MKLVEAEVQNSTVLLYTDPKRYIEKYVLPTYVRCPKCETKMLLDFATDLQPFHNGDKWDLECECMICKVRMPVRFDRSKNIDRDTITKYLVSQLKWHDRFAAEHAAFCGFMVLMVCIVVISLSVGFFFGPNIAAITGAILFSAFVLSAAFADAI